MTDVESFKKRIKTTAYAKFDAHKRYERLNNTSLFALTSASSLLIFISLFNKYSAHLCPEINQSLVELFSIVVSIIILILSLVVAFASYSLKSERHLRCGNEMIDLHDQLIISSNDEHQTRNIINEYIVLRKSADNHKRFHYTRGRLERKNEQDALSVKDEDKTTVYEDIEYLAPIIAYYFISLFSLSTFVFMVIFCIKYA